MHYELVGLVLVLVLGVVVLGYALFGLKSSLTRQQAAMQQQASAMTKVDESILLQQKAFALAEENAQRATQGIEMLETMLKLQREQNDLFRALIEGLDAPESEEDDAEEIAGSDA